MSKGCQILDTNCYLSLPKTSPGITSEVREREARNGIRHLLLLDAHMNPADPWAWLRIAGLKPRTEPWHFRDAQVRKNSENGFGWNLLEKPVLWTRWTRK